MKRQNIFSVRSTKIMLEDLGVCHVQEYIVTSVQDLRNTKFFMKQVVVKGFVVQGGNRMKHILEYYRDEALLIIFFLIVLIVCYFKQ